MKKLTLAVAALVSGCGYVPGTDAWAIRESENKVKQLLSDPKSADFQLEKVADGSPKLVCGEVNARNKLGGKAGWTRYFSYADGQADFANDAKGGLSISDFDLASDDAVDQHHRVFESIWIERCA